MPSRPRGAPVVAAQVERSGRTRRDRRGLEIPEAVSRHLANLAKQSKRSQNNFDRQDEDQIIFDLVHQFG
jgi:hypothetical protein